MRSLITSILYMPLAALLLTTGRAEPGARQLSLHGTIQSSEVLDFTGFPTAVTSTAVATGHASLLGKFTATWVVTIDFSSPGGAAVGHGVFTAANGDTLFTTTVGRGTPTEDPDVVSIVDEQTVIGGTGRFAGATGSFIRHSLANLTTGLTSGSFSGSITVPNGAH